MALRVDSSILRIGAIDHFGIHARLHGVQHVAAGQVDGRRAIEVEIDVGPVRGDDRPDHARHVAAGQVMGLEPLRGDAGRGSLPMPACMAMIFDCTIDPSVDLTKAHRDQPQQADLGIGHVGLKPQVAIGQHDPDQHQHHRQQQHGDGANGEGLRNLCGQQRCERIHIGFLGSEGKSVTPGGCSWCARAARPSVAANT